MPDREKVIKGLEHCGFNEKRGCVGCPYSDECGDFGHDAGMSSLATDALALLREQEKPDCEHAEHDGVGCLGYAGCTQDDEPIDVCKTCRKYTGNRYGEVSGDA